MSIYGILNAYSAPCAIKTRKSAVPERQQHSTTSTSIQPRHTLYKQGRKTMCFRKFHKNAASASAAFIPSSMSRSWIYMSNFQDENSTYILLLHTRQHIAGPQWRPSLSSEHCVYDGALWGKLSRFPNVLHSTIHNFRQHIYFCTIYCCIVCLFTVSRWTMEHTDTFMHNMLYFHWKWKTQQ